MDCHTDGHCLMPATSKKICCRICGGMEAAEWWHPREMMFGFREIFAYFRCAACGCLQIDEVPADMGKYYPDNYYSYGTIQDAPNSLPAALKRKWFRRPMTRHKLGGRSVAGRLLNGLRPGMDIPEWLGFLKRPVSLDGGVLDVGCGSGTTLLWLRDCGFTNLLGVDPFIKQPLSYPGGVRVNKCQLQEVTGRFGLVTFHHVFEHLENPLATLQQAGQLLTDGGQILIRIPVSDSLAAQKYKENWVDLDAPRHVTLQTRRSMELLAKKAKMKIVRVVYDSTEFQFWGSEQYMLDVPLMDPRSHLTDSKNGLFPRDKIKWFAEESTRLNGDQAGDQAAFVLVMEDAKSR
jgi:SAM-dependent methyltransferase